MSVIPPCCQRLTSFTPCPTPFLQRIALDFYDGLSSGLVRCEQCGTGYAFDMLGWDDDHEVRVVRLARLPPGTVQRCVRVPSPLEPARRPVCVRHVQTRPSERY